MNNSHSTDYYFEEENRMAANEEYNFTSDRGEILNALQKSKDNQTMVALTVPDIGAGLFITAVDAIIQNENETIIILKQYDITGCMLEKNKFQLNEIVSACSLKSKWVNPYIKTFTKDNVPWLRIEDRL